MNENNLLLASSSSSSSSVDKCLSVLKDDYLPCPGKYCGRLLLNESLCSYSACQKCPRGSRPIRIESIGIGGGGGGGDLNYNVCQLCTNESTDYDYLYMFFIFNLIILINFYFIDKSYALIHTKRKLPFHWLRSLLVYSLPVLECLLSFGASLFCFTVFIFRGGPAAASSSSLSFFSIFKLTKSCRIDSITDWYPIFFNPYIDYHTKLNCSQEIVYPLYSIVLVFLAFNVAIMILTRPLFIYFIYRNINQNNKSVDQQHQQQQEQQQQMQRKDSAGTVVPRIVLDYDKPTTSQAANMVVYDEIEQQNNEKSSSPGTAAEERRSSSTSENNNNKNNADDSSKKKSLSVAKTPNYYRSHLNDATFIALYVNPIVFLVHCITGGLLYYLFPILTTCAMLISNAYYITQQFRQSPLELLLNQTSQTTPKSSGNYFRISWQRFKYLFKPSRNLCISLIHIYMFMVSFLSMRKYYDQVINSYHQSDYYNNKMTTDVESTTALNAAIIAEYALIVVVLPFAPFIFYVLTFEFTDPKNFRNFI